MPGSILIDLHQVFHGLLGISQPSRYLAKRFGDFHIELLPLLRYANLFWNDALASLIAMTNS